MWQTINISYPKYIHFFIIKAEIYDDKLYITAITDGSISFDSEIGMEFEDAEKRWDAYTLQEDRIPFLVEKLNEITKGGFTRKTLNCFMSSNTGGFKSGAMCSLSCDYIRQGYNVLYLSFEMAENKKGITGENLLQILESRLDNVVYRAGFGVSRAQARQLVNHGHFDVNGKKVDVCSYLVKPGDVISVREIKKDTAIIKMNLEANAARPVPAWLEKDAEKLSGKVVRLAAREDIDLAVEEHLIVELYSK